MTDIFGLPFLGGALLLNVIATVWWVSGIHHKVEANATWIEKHDNMAADVAAMKANIEAIKDSVEALRSLLISNRFAEPEQTPYDHRSFS